MKEKMITRLLSAVLCTALLGTTLIVGTTPEASAAGLFGGGGSLFDRIAGRTEGRESLLGRLEDAVQEYENGSEERETRRNALREAAESAADQFREEHSDLGERLDEAENDLQAAAEGIRDRFESRTAAAEDGQSLTESSASSVSGEAAGTTDSGTASGLDVSRRIEERIAERSAKAAGLQESAEEETPADGSEDRLSSIRERLETVRQDIEERREERENSQDDGRSLQERLEQLRSDLEEASQNIGENRGEEIDRIREEIDRLEKQVQEDEKNADTEKRETKKKAWTLSNWIQHPKEMVLFQLFQKLSEPKEHHVSERKERNTGWNPDGGGQQISSAAVTTQPAESPTTDTEEETEEEQMADQVGGTEPETLEEEQVPLAMPLTEVEPTALNVTPWYLKPEMAVPFVGVVGVGSVSVFTALKSRVRAKRKTPEMESVPGSSI